MVGDGEFDAKSSWQGEVCGKMGLSQEPPQASWRGSRGAIPGAGGDGWAGGSGVGQDGAGQEGELRVALAGLLLVDELASGAEHLLGGQRQLLNRPAVAVQFAEDR
jgi:hypothetical protein